MKVIEVKTNRKFLELAKHAGIHKVEMKVIYHALRNGAVALLEDETVRSFARSLGVEVRGSLGLLLEGLKNCIITNDNALKGIDKLSEIMYLSSDIYKEVLLKVKELAQKTKKDEPLRTLKTFKVEG